MLRYFLPSVVLCSFAVFFFNLLSYILVDQLIYLCIIDVQLYQTMPNMTCSIQIISNQTFSWDYRQRFCVSALPTHLDGTQAISWDACCRGRWNRGFALWIWQTAGSFRTSVESSALNCHTRLQTSVKFTCFHLCSAKSSGIGRVRKTLRCHRKRKTCSDLIDWQIPSHDMIELQRDCFCRWRTSNTHCDALKPRWGKNKMN